MYSYVTISIVLLMFKIFPTISCSSRSKKAQKYNRPNQRIKGSQTIKSPRRISPSKMPAAASKGGDKKQVKLLNQSQTKEQVQKQNSPNQRQVHNRNHKAQRPAIRMHLPHAASVVRRATPRGPNSVLSTWSQRETTTRIQSYTKFQAHR